MSNFSITKPFSIFNTDPEKRTFVPAQSKPMVFHKEPYQPPEVRSRLGLDCDVADDPFQGYNPVRITPFCQYFYPYGGEPVH